MLVLNDHETTQYLDEVDTLDDVDNEDDVDTELEVDTLRGKESDITCNISSEVCKNITTKA